ncbi:restriction endonuclease subunit S [Xanthocytophaga flava]|uniref:restriction endonuclease subunit S n=1 Tax=Xanthocytophaga flava TaxID=3048013 RepID=UPI0028D2DD72|nr:restriction endonuclease subunit S [Xanthocytophaga flavus]MDJ1472444.1 restriction endonuclease subunit S [Xanthocytophaga flavus]
MNTELQLSLFESTEKKTNYKHTPLGWIPEEWQVKELISVSLNGTQNGYYKGKEFYGRGYEMVHMTEVFAREKIENGGMSLVDLDEEELKRFSLKEGDLLFARRSLALEGVGKCIVVGKISSPITFESSIIRVSLKKDVIEALFAYYYISSIRGRIEMLRLARQVAVSGITGEDLKRYKILIPPLPEQRKIAAILSTWDEAITQTQQLIAQLQQRNKGLMQQLLTGKKRLPGFEGEWRKLHLHEIAKEVVLKNREGKDLIVLSCTKYDGLVPSLEYFGRRVFGSDTSTYKVVPLHHFAYATNHIEEGSIGYQSRFEEALISPMYTVFKTNGQVYDDYLFKLLKSHQYIHEYQKRMEGSIDRRGGLRWDEFSKIIVHLPDTAEQVAIAALLNQADDEVKLYEQKLAALQQQKKGLMQKLMTGQVRV